MRHSMNQAKEICKVSNSFCLKDTSDSRHTIKYYLTAFCSLLCALADLGQEEREIRRHLDQTRSLSHSLDTYITQVEAHAATLEQYTYIIV
jgi:hypothetical protein